MILDGKVVAASIKEQLQEEIDAAVANGGRRPKLVIISVGDDPASKVYVRNKMKAAEEVGVDVDHRCFTEAEKVLNFIQYCNHEHLIDGIYTYMYHACQVASVMSL